MKSTSFTWFLVLLFISIDSEAQKHSANWYFGNRAGIRFDFTTNPPTPSAVSLSSMSASEGCASISDADSGNLLFYTNGNVVYNKLHQQMFNGSGLMGNSLSAQSAVIVPKPDSKDTFYIFTVDDWVSGRGMYYSVVDMTANSGLGSVIQKNIQLDSRCQERVVAIYHANCRDIWIVSHQKNNDTLVTYLLSPAGVSAPAYQKTGSVQAGNNRFGGMKFSSDSRWLVSALGGGSGTDVVLELWNFNNSTGTFSNPISLLTANDASATYSAEFSPSGNMLYSVQFNNSTLCQFDLSSGNAAAIRASRINLSVGSATKSVLQAGPDGRIYVAGRPRTTMDVIYEPEKRGSLCDFRANDLTLTWGASAQIGLPNFLPVLGRSIPPHDSIKPVYICSGLFDFKPDSMFLKSRYVLQWNFGDTASGVLNQYAGKAASHQFKKEGGYIVRLIIMDTLWSCNPIDTDYVRVTFLQEKSPLALGDDKFLCKSALPVWVDSRMPGYRYCWNNNAADSFQGKFVNDPGLFSLELYRKCDTLRDTIVITLLQDSVPDLKLGPMICISGPVQLDPGVRNGEFRWSDGDSSCCPVVSDAGTYKLIYRNSCSTYQDSVSINLKGIEVFRLPSDTMICSGDTLFLAPEANGKIFWFDSIQAPEFHVSESMLCWAVFYGTCDTISDTLNVVKDLPEKLSLRNDTVLCSHSPIELHSGLNPVQWSNGETTPSILISTPGTYICQYTDLCDTLTDTVRISWLQNEFLKLPEDTILCHDIPLKIVAEYSSGKLLWMNGSTEPFLISAAQELIHVTMYGICDTLSDSISITRIPKNTINAGNDTILCQGQQIWVQAGKGEGTYLWSDGESVADRFLTDTGLYVLYYKDQCDTLTDSIRISTPLMPKQNHQDFLICRTINLLLEASPGYDKYVWSVGKEGISILTRDSGLHTVQMFKKNCSVTDSFTVRFEASPPIYLPNAFSPDNNLINDLFPAQQMPFSEISIYDRWGSLVYHGNEPWDGTINGKAVAEGVYFYILQYSGCEHKVYHGTVTLIR